MYQLTSRGTRIAHSCSDLLLASLSYSKGELLKVTSIDALDMPTGGVYLLLVSSCMHSEELNPR